MLLSKFVYTKISSSNVLYWRSLGYDVSGGGRAGINNGKRLKVKVEELKPNSNINVSCRCNKCGTKYIQRFSRNKDVCYPCRRYEAALGNSYGTVNKGKPNFKQRGENHPNWNPNKSEFQKYSQQVRWESEKVYRANKHILNPDNLPRTKCGVPGGYQLDHILTIASAFDRGIPIEEVATLSNLRMIPWEINSTRPKRE